MAIFSRNGQSDRVTFRDGVLLLERPTSGKAFITQTVSAVVDLAILGFFLAGPYLRSSPSYLIIDYTIAVWIAFELIMRVIDETISRAAVKYGQIPTVAETNDRLAQAIRRASTLPFRDPVTPRAR